MKNIHQIPQARAEMLLNYFYPELENQWTVDNKGSFYRNYNHDILALYMDEGRVDLARDGFLKLLPEGLLTGETNVRGKDAAEKLKEVERRMHLLREAFLPLDTFAFHRRLRVERQLSELLNDKMEYLLKEYFGFDLDAEKNPYVRQLAVLLPFAKSWRGNLGMLRNLLSVIFACEVKMTQHMYSDSDTTKHRLPLVRYDLLIKGLDAAAYRKMRADVLKVADFFTEWFIPMDMVCQIYVKEYHHPQNLNNRLVLNYNSEVEQHI
jgi:hypothetical protein